MDVLGGPGFPQRASGALGPGHATALGGSRRPRDLAHRQIPESNGKMERSQRTDQDEFYGILGSLSNFKSCDGASHSGHLRSCLQPGRRLILCWVTLNLACGTLIA
jgi:hypothetical protein